MQVTVAARLHRETLDMFPPVAWPEGRSMFQVRYQPNLDASEMAAAFASRPWTEIPRRTLFLHREAMFLLSAEAFRAYLPAYLAACLEPEDDYSADLGWYTVRSLVEDSSRTIEDTRERIHLLDEAQRRVIADVIGYIAMWGRIRDAWDALEVWRR